MAISNDLLITVKAVGIPEAEAQLKKLFATMTKLTVNQNGSVSATGKLTSALDSQAKSTDRVVKSTDRVASATGRASKKQEDYLYHVGKTTVLSALVNKLFLEFVDVSGQALKQVDLMNNFPVTMASMGQSTDAANKSLQVLRDYVGQIGGDLGDATSYVTRFVGATGDVRAATAIFVGLNNALIAGDSSLEEQRGAMLQFAQALERGKIEAKEWNILTQNMSFQLTQVAESMGYVSSAALREAMVEGEESMASFTTALTKMATGTGPIVSQAEARMNGMQFAFNRMKNALVQGIAAIVDSLGRQNIVSFFTFMTQVAIVLTRAIVNLIKWVLTLLNLLGSLFGLPAIKLKNDIAGVADSISTGADNAGDLADGLSGAGKEAKKLNKSLAAFDKMNVLPDQDTSSGSDGGADGGAGSGFDGTQIGELGDIFGDIGGEIQEVSKWAKIFASILGALAANKLIEKIFGINPLKLFAKGIVKYAILPLLSFGKIAALSVGTFGAALGRGLLGLGSGGSGVLGTAATLGAKIGLAVRGAFLAVFSGFGSLLRILILNPLKLLWVPIAAIATVIAGALSIPFAAAVAIVVAIIAVIVGVVYLIWTNWQTIWGWITTAFTASVQFISEVWGTLYNIFAGPIKWVLQFIGAIFILIIAIIATALELIFKLVVGTVMLIYGVLAAIAGWINENVIQPIWQFFQWLWDTITGAVVSAWHFILESVLRPIASWINVNVIQPVSNFFKGLWNSVSGFVSGAITRIKNFLGPLGGWIKSNVIDRIAGFFSGLWNGVQTGLSTMINGLKNIFSGIGNVFKTPINGIIDLINRVLQGLNNTVKVPTWVPQFGGKGVNFPSIPRLERGGVVNQATMAMIGENGSEAVMPLENNTEWIDKLASKINNTPERNGDSHIPSKLDQESSSNITINVSGVFATSIAEQRKVADLIAKRINESTRGRSMQGAR